MKCQKWAIKLCKSWAYDHAVHLESWSLWDRITHWQTPMANKHSDNSEDDLLASIDHFGNHSEVPHALQPHNWFLKLVVGVLKLFFQRWVFVFINGLQNSSIPKYFACLFASLCLAMDNHLCWAGISQLFHKQSNQVSCKVILKLIPTPSVLTPMRTTHLRTILYI